MRLWVVYKQRSWQFVSIFHRHIAAFWEHEIAAFGLATPIATSLTAGGPAVMVWGYTTILTTRPSIAKWINSLVLVSVLCEALAVSLAEICSKYPTSAGAYYWAFRLASPRYRLLCSWINGWLTMVGVWTIGLSVNFVCQSPSLERVSINDDRERPNCWLRLLGSLSQIG